jgi:hypothetical protein
MNNISLETIARSKKSREQIQAKSNIPSQLLDSAENLVDLLEAYYKFMNSKDLTYREDSQRYTATVIEGSVVFETTNNKFFFDDTFAESKIIDGSGNEIQDEASLIQIRSGNTVPESMVLDNVVYGTQFAIEGIGSYEGTIVTLITPVQVYAGDQPSRVMADLKNLRNINETPDKYLDQIHSEYAAAVPRQLSVDKILLYKNLIQFYKERGSRDSIEVFFRLLLGDVVDVYYPSEDMLIPSSGTWDPSISVPVLDD